MSLTQHNPWNLFDQLQHELNRTHSHSHKLAANGDIVTSDWTPAVDIKEEDNQFLLIADIPGVDPENIDIHMENGILTIKGERNSELKTEHDGFKRIERKHGVFYRRFTMPEGVNPEGIDAKSNNGVLTVSIPKQEAVKPRKITVN
ncbi:MAG: heat-shock protein Hsp20 [endosymbiont of Galathealinum brachiosum]|uniref:Heat-shock protein Hsp20 n=1 Tax=endosymbiont of Galathealinum brachiosum TaxID=2200906 RepID=A0A370DAN5_9GAMM|nr:MAG: heat-shock protein Hsp20 [endosymbiont of Galathealinum brachiosum]